jgi:hypothetical protein
VLAKEKLGLKGREPFKTVLSSDRAAIAQLPTHAALWPLQNFTGAIGNSQASLLRSAVPVATVFAASGNLSLCRRTAASGEGTGQPSILPGILSLTGSTANPDCVKQAELRDGLRNREEIAIERASDAIDEVQFPSESAS